MKWLGVLLTAVLAGSRAGRPPFSGAVAKTEQTRNCSCCYSAGSSIKALEHWPVRRSRARLSQGQTRAGYRHTVSVASSSRCEDTEVTEKITGPLDRCSAAGDQPLHTSEYVSVYVV